VTTLVEKDSPVPALILLAVIFLFLLGGAVGLAYMGGVFTGKDAVAENDKRITAQAVPISAPVSAPGSAKP